jgi:hypothetical protein
MEDDTICDSVSFLRCDTRLPDWKWLLSSTDADHETTWSRLRIARTDTHALKPVKSLSRSSIRFQRVKEARPTERNAGQKLKCVMRQHVRPNLYMSDATWTLQTAKSNHITRQTFVRNKYGACFISCSLCSQHVSAFTKSHLQVILYNTKYLKRSYHINATDPLSQH